MQTTEILPVATLLAKQLQVKIYENRELLGADAAKDAADKIRELLHTKTGDINIIFAAAPSQNEFLACLSVEEDIDWSRIKAFHMDEYIGLDDDAPQRFGHFLQVGLFDKVPMGEVFYIDGSTSDPSQECVRYANLLQQYPADIVCMGIGENTHIAFNDPHTAKFNDDVLVKIVDLDGASRMQQVHDRCFDRLEQVPVSAITLTVPALLQAETIFCMVPGEKKATAIYHTIHNDISEQYPSTVLQSHHNATLYIDKDSAGKLGNVQRA